MGERIQGVVKFFNDQRGFGIIIADDRRDIFVHFRDIEGSDRLSQGQRVEFRMGTGRDGRPVAKQVRAFGAGSPRRATVENDTMRSPRTRQRGNERSHPADRDDDGGNRQGESGATARPFSQSIADVIATDVSAPSSSCHLGLRLYRYLDTWSKNDKGQWEIGKNARVSFFNTIKRLNAELSAGDGKELLEIHSARVNARIAALKNAGWVVEEKTMKSSWRFVSGMGISHPFETGLALHHTLGVPFLPGSSAKGAALAQARLVGKKSVNHDVFGNTKDAGHVVFFDVMPATWPVIDIDIINPHFARYYQGLEAPGDWLTPIPIHFLAVGANQPFRFIAAARPPRNGSKARSAADMASAAIELLLDAAQNEGLGGKSAAGYGYFTS